MNKCSLPSSPVTQMMDLWRFPVLSEGSDDTADSTSQRVTALSSSTLMQLVLSVVEQKRFFALCCVFCGNGAESVTATKNQTDQQETQLMLSSSPPHHRTAVARQGCGNWTCGGFLWCLCAGVWSCGCRYSDL